MFDKSPWKPSGPAEAAIAFNTFGIDYEDIRASAIRHGVAEHLLPEHIPCNRAEYRRLWEAPRHLICVNEQTRGALDAILHPRALDGDRAKAVLFWAYPMLAHVGLALIPRHIRHTSGVPSSASGDAMAIAAGRATAELLVRRSTYPALLKRLCPHGYQIQTPALRTGR